jgi:glutamate-1-semialdehyde 2,1-aminomutase
VPAGAAADTLVCRYNDVEDVRATVERHAEDLAAVVVEPVAGNMGVVPPEPGFLEGLRALCDAAGSLLVFDEVITGFRVARGGAQERYGVTPDLTVLGKIAGGGLPLAAFGGRADVMDELAPAGPVYQAGTLSGNPLATAAALATLPRLRDLAVYERLEEAGARLQAGLEEAATGKPVTVQRVGAMATLFFREAPVRTFEDATASDAERYGGWFRHLLARGVYVAPSQFEALFLSTARVQHSELPALLGVELDERNEGETDSLQHTDVHGLFLAGDADGDVQFAIVAAAEGAKAGVAINLELQKELLL